MVSKEMNREMRIIPSLFLPFPLFSSFVSFLPPYLSCLSISPALSPNLQTFLSVYNSLANSTRNVTWFAIIKTGKESNFVSPFITKKNKRGNMKSLKTRREPLANMNKRRRAAINNLHPMRHLENERWHEQLLRTDQESFSNKTKNL